MGVKNRHRDCWNAIRHDIIWEGKDYLMLFDGRVLLFSFLRRLKPEKRKQTQLNLNTVSRMLDIDTVSKHNEDTTSTIRYHTWMKHFKYSKLRFHFVWCLRLLVEWFHNSYKDLMTQFLVGQHQCFFSGCANVSSALVSTLFSACHQHTF